LDSDQTYMCDRLAPNPKQGSFSMYVDLFGQGFFPEGWRFPSRPNLTSGFVALCYWSLVVQRPARDARR